jgi:hypothetical protein
VCNSIVPCNDTAPGPGREGISSCMENNFIIKSPINQIDCFDGDIGAVYIELPSGFELRDLERRLGTSGLELPGLMDLMDLFRLSRLCVTYKARSDIQF